MSDGHSNTKMLLAMVVICGAVFSLDMPKPEIPLPDNTEFVQQVTNSKPVIVKFGAKWCPPCRHLETELERLSRNYGSRVHVVHVDIDQDPELAAHYGVRTIPHVILFQYGQQLNEFKGSRSAEEIAEWAGLRP